MWNRSLWAWTVVCVSVVGGSVDVATQAPQPAFDVVSVKKRTPTSGAFAPHVVRDGVFSTQNHVNGLLQFAYNLRDLDIVGGPDWMLRDLFVVNARAGHDASQDEMRVMVQSLLKDRFRLVAHEEQRERDHFTMTLVRRDGAPGLALLRRDDCANPLTRPKRPDPPAGAATSGGCGSMSRLADVVTMMLDTPVIDRTGIAGTFDYALFYSRADFRLPRALALGATPILASRPADDVFPSLREAIRDQLGLTLEPVRGPLRVLVVDSVEQPTDN